MVAAGSSGFQVRFVRLHAGGDGEDHGLAHRARDAEDVGGHDAGEGGRHHHLDGGLEARGAHGIGTLAQVHRHGTHGVLGDRAHRRDDHDAHHQAGREQVEAGQFRDELLQQRCDEEQGKIAVHDGRDAGEQFQHRLDGLAQARPGELGEEDRDHGAERDGHQQRHAGADQGARQQHHDAEVGVVEERRPLRVGQEIPQRHVAEEHHGFRDQDIDDAKRGKHRDHRRQEQDRLDEPFLEVARGAVSETVGHGHGQNRHQSLASRFISSSMVMPTSAVPPKTVPSLPFLRWSILPI